MKKTTVCLFAALLACLPTAHAAANEAELLAKMPHEILEAFARGGRPDKDGLVGANHRDGWIHVAMQRGAMLQLAAAVARGDAAQADDAWRAIDAAFARQTEAGNFEIGKFEGKTHSYGDDLSGVAFWLSEMGEALLVVRESPLAEYFKPRLDALLPKIARAVKWLAGGEAELARYDSHAPNRLFFDAKAFGFAGLLLRDDSLLPVARRFFEAGLKMQRDDGAFLERGGGDTSYQAVNLVKLQVYALRFPDARIDDAVARGVKWELAHIKPSGEVDTADNTRVRPGGEKFLGHEKAVSYSEVILALLFYHTRTGDKDAADAAERAFRFVTKARSRKAPAQEAATSLEQVATGFRLAEGPVWDGESLVFSDVFPSRIHKLGSDGKVSTIRSDTRKGAGLAFDSKGRLLICEVDGFRVARVEKDGSVTTLADAYDGRKLNGPNDLVVDAKDGVYFTDPLFLNKDKREQDKEAVYYISPDGKVIRVADDLEKPNGIALTGDGKTLLVADTAKSKLRAYPVREDGTLGEGHDFGTVPGPDGVRVDLDGKVYAAGKTGIAVWDATGELLGTLKVPAPLTSLAFGDADRRTMFITTNPSVFKIRLDQALKMLTADESAAAKDLPPPAPTEAVHQRVAARVGRVKEGAHKWAESGRDISAIQRTMEEKVKPLLDAGKFGEAKAELDRVLE